MAGGAPVNGCFAWNAVSADRAIDGNMGRDIALFEGLDEVEDVISFVSAQRDAPARTTLVEPCQDHLALGVPRGVSHSTADGKAIAMLHHRVGHITKPALAAVALAIEPSVRVAGALMRLVGSLLAPEALFAIAPAIRRIAAAILRPEALHRGPGVETCIE